MSDTTVYIIGAGCSVKYGYPLAANFVPAFKSFSQSLDSDSPRLKESVDETVLLMHAANVQTVDELVFRIHNGALDDPKHSPTQCYGLRLRRILNVNSLQVQSAEKCVYFRDARLEPQLKANFYHGWKSGQRAYERIVSAGFTWRGK